jgi:O-antigen ligase
MLALVIYSPKLRHKLLFAFIFAISTACLLMTYTRGAWLAWAFSLFILVLMWRPRLALGCGIRRHLGSPASGVDIRQDYDDFYFRLLHEEPRADIYGYFTLNKTQCRAGRRPRLDERARAVVKDNYYTGGAYFVHGHNLLLQLWGESGIFALVSWFFAMFFPIKKALRAGARKADDKSMIARGVNAVPSQD